MKDVCLVSMPFGNIFSPSMGLSLLKGGLNREGISSRIHYFTLNFSRLIGQTGYCNIADDVRPSVRELAGEWLFARAVFGDDIDDHAYIHQILEIRRGWVTDYGLRPLSRKTIEWLKHTRQQVDSFLSDCLDTIARDRPRIVGFTSVFQQHVASLALARRVKARLPETFIVFGGANCEGVMGAETARQFPFIDAVVSGEADLVFPDLVAKVLQRKSIAGIRGVLTNENAAQAFASQKFESSPSVYKMDDLAYPDFDDFFEQYSACTISRYWQPRIFFETSRGCWWGEKQHCTFCGLNGTTMTFRSKSPGRVMDELDHLTRRHPDCKIQVVDNILDMRYFNDLLPALAARKSKVKLFYETKANLRKDQLELMRNAGILEIQPGIESFADSVLDLMHKGVSGLQNIQLLKWCKEVGVRPYWNVLWGFPGEPPEDYARMAAEVPWLTHLHAPGSYYGVRLDRFSPNFFDSDRLGFKDVRPLPAYFHVYPLAKEAVANLAYHFAFDYQKPQPVQSYPRPLLRQLIKWKGIANDSDLFFADTGEYTIVWDLRPAAKEVLTVINGTQRKLYKACDGIRDIRQLIRSVSMSEDEVSGLLAPLVARGLLLKRGTRYLALAIRLGQYSPQPRITRKFYGLVKRLGAAGDGGCKIALTRKTDGLLGAESIPNSKGFPRTPRRVAASQFSITDRGELFVCFAFVPQQPTKGELNAIEETGGKEDHYEETRKEKESRQKEDQEASTVLNV